jgi:hypothetical protein
VAGSPGRKAQSSVRRARKFLRRSSRRLVKRFRISLRVVEGREATSGAPLSILHTGRGRIDPYFARLAFGDSYQVREAGSTWLWNLPRAIRQQGRDCDLALVEIRKFGPRALRLVKGFQIPRWLIGECDLPCRASVLKNSSICSDLSRIRRNELYFEITRDEQHFDDFYQNMYLPHAKEAHGEAAFFRTHEELKQLLGNGELLLVLKDGQAIAGVLIEHKDGMPHLRSLGARDGNRDYLRFGGVAALYHFSIVCLAEQGHTKLGLGMSRAFTDDGVFRYKKKWGQRIVGSKRESLVLRALSSSPGATAFLVAHPFIHRKNGALVAAVFSPSDRAPSAEDRQRIENEYAQIGLPGVEFHSTPAAGLGQQESSR